MAYLINKDYFFGGNCEIAQLTEDSVSLQIANMIAIYEPKILTCLLGADLYLDFKTAYDQSVLTLNPVALPDKYAKLLNGEIYVGKYGSNQKWFGLRNETSKQSLIANYVYFYWMRKIASATTGTGEKNLTAENSSNSFVIYKQNQAWREMVQWNKDLRSYLQSKTETFDTWNDPLQRPVYADCRDLFHTNNNLNF